MTEERNLGFLTCEHRQSSRPFASTDEFEDDLHSSPGSVSVLYPMAKVQRDILVDRLQPPLPLQQRMSKG